MKNAIRLLLLVLVVAATLITAPSPSAEADQWIGCPGTCTGNIGCLYCQDEYYLYNCSGGCRTCARVNIDPEPYTWCIGGGL